MESIKVVIGIQARTHSTRLPNKAMKRIRGITMVDRIINTCLKSEKYINRFTRRSGIEVVTYVLIPEGDPLKEYLSDKEVGILEGPEQDLISRYKVLMDKEDPDYLVRITADCFLLPPFLITKCINTAVKNKYNFTTTAHPEFRTFFDGADVEVVDKELFEWLDKNSTEREHVFAYLVSNYPDWYRPGLICNYLDLSAFKLSVDTQKDFDLTCKQYNSLMDKKEKWSKLWGESSVHQF